MLHMPQPAVSRKQFVGSQGLFLGWSFRASSVIVQLSIKSRTLNLIFSGVGLTLY